MVCRRIGDVSRRVWTLLAALAAGEFKVLPWAANVALAIVEKPAIMIGDNFGAELNVDVSGKSINSIRTFPGRGTLIWGARTLAGNDNEWRYVSVRRFCSFIEGSVKNALEAFVFEPNDTNTWVRVRGMIEKVIGSSS